MAEDACCVFGVDWVVNELAVRRCFPALLQHGAEIL